MCNSITLSETKLIREKIEDVNNEIRRSFDTDWGVWKLSEAAVYLALSACNKCRNLHGHFCVHAWSTRSQVSKTVYRVFDRPVYSIRQNTKKLWTQLSFPHYPLAIIN